MVTAIIVAVIVFILFRPKVKVHVEECERHTWTYDNIKKQLYCSKCNKLPG